MLASIVSFRGGRPRILARDGRTYAYMRAYSDCHVVTVLIIYIPGRIQAPLDNRKSTLRCFFYLYRALSPPKGG